MNSSSPKTGTILPGINSGSIICIYHGLILEDLLDLLNLAGVYSGVLADEVIDIWREAAQSMGGWLQVMCHPDGEIALFNDAAFGIAPAPAELFAYAKRQEILPKSPFSEAAGEFA